MTLRFPVEDVDSSVDDVVNEIRAAVLSRPTSYIHCTGSRYCMTRDLSGSPKAQGATDEVDLMTTPLTPEEAVNSFIELQEELRDIHSAGQYTLVMRQLVRIKEALGASPARMRVRTAIRDLQERLPQIREKGHQAQAIRVNTRIAELERQSLCCPRGHSMVVRHGPNDSLFWGCSHFPFCHYTKRLTAEQRRRLGS